MLTLLPLLRITAAVVLGVMMLLLSSLWAIGIEITPLLAGASPGGARMNGNSATPNAGQRSGRGDRSTIVVTRTAPEGSPLR